MEVQPPRPSQPPPLPQPSSPSQREPDLSAAHVSRLFQAADRNSDGRITRAELIKACRADAHFRSVLGLPERIQEDQRDLLERVFQGMDADDSRSLMLILTASWNGFSCNLTVLITSLI